MESPTSKYFKKRKEITSELLTLNKKLHLNQPNAQTVSCAQHSVFNNVCTCISKKKCLRSNYKHYSSSI